MSSFYEEDVDPELPGQVVAVVSMIGPDLHQKSDIPAYKIRGVYSNEESAKKRVEHLKKIESASEYSPDIYLVDVGKWIPMKFKLDNTSDVIGYDNPVLDELMKGFKTNVEQGKKMFEERKKALQKGEVLVEDLELTLSNMIKEKDELEDRIRQTRDFINTKLIQEKPISEEV